MKKTLKRLVASLLIGIMAVGLTACGGSSSTPEAASGSAASGGSSSGGGSKGVIAYSCYNMSWEYYVTLAQGVKDAAEAAGYEYVEHDQQSDQNLMVQGCTDLLNQNIACLVLTPCKPEATASITKLAAEKGIPVIFADIGTDASEEFVACLKSDNYDGGVLAGNYAVEHLKEGSKKAAVITVDPSNTNIVRTDGVQDVVKENGYEVVAELSGKSEPDVAYSCMQDILTANPDVQIVFCGNDPMAISASQAISDAGLTPGKDVYVIGYDAQTSVFEPIENGTVMATVAQDPYGMGSGSVECFLKTLDGETLEFDDAEQKLIYTDQWIIDADNAADYK